MALKKGYRIQNIIYQTVRGKDRLGKMLDVDSTSISDGEVLVWNSTTAKREGKKIEDIGALDYKGVWNASTNSPTLASGVGLKGDYYKVSVKGTTTIDGMSDREVGDVILFNGTIRQRIAGGESYVDLTDNQTINGIKTFVSSPIVPSPVNSTDATNKESSENFAIAMGVAL